MAPRQTTTFARANTARIRQPNIGLRLQSQRKRQRVDDLNNNETSPKLQLQDIYKSIDNTISQSTNKDIDNDDNKIL